MTAECDSTYVKHRSDNVFDKSSDKEISQISRAKNTPFGLNKQKYLRGKGGRKVNNNNK